MENLNAYGVSEITMEETFNTDGGFWHIVVGALIWVGLSTAWDILNDWDHSVDCFHEGYNSVVRDDIYR